MFSVEYDSIARHLPILLFWRTPTIATHAKISTHATHAKILWTHATHAKISTHAIHVTHAKILWTHATHATHAKIWPTPLTYPRTHAIHATHEPTPPTQFSRLTMDDVLFFVRLDV